jgi:hypothetical protein
LVQKTIATTPASQAIPHLIVAGISSGKSHPYDGVAERGRLTARATSSEQELESQL